ncbi:hypothetical protein M409DRAFT_23180 [Zasmidium cellare ATCC 36951]|uniref:Uncharacterized protein n=1 Tax=Zasmidium cellare ATCC 36951 TaxID=1080233 RepID=A0A6A6CKT1_ZASCE|nr:uncharacterized protein M409DRAFT_23180 [Zasmidium cellare ATCC 36951]KAF2166542.1 hypothetical protein M409DRAFT_23180 [Zasmidium cellare ATCC 36951]
MKSIHLLSLPILTLTLLALLPLPLATSDYTNALACARRNPSINAAISKLCTRRDKAGNLFNKIVVPSPYTSQGATVDGVRVRITGTCSPPQWVPLQYCGAQFHGICAGGGSVGRFGRSGCQVWRIERVDGGRVAGLVGEVVEGMGRVREGGGNLVGAVRGG